MNGEGGVGVRTGGKSTLPTDYQIADLMGDTVAITNRIRSRLAHDGAAHNMLRCQRTGSGPQGAGGLNHLQPFLPGLLRQGSAIG